MPSQFTRSSKWILGLGCALALAVPFSGAHARKARETLLHSFQGGATDGAHPNALIADSAGNLYGTTTSGGSKKCDDGCGIVFKLTADGTETVLHFFKGGKDGAHPEDGLVADSSGNLYGTTIAGGDGTCSLGCGTVFMLKSDGTETVLHSFEGGKDGANPYAGLIADNSGNFYGTTSAGGDGNCSSGCGTVFMLKPDGTETVLYSFEGGKDGALPVAGLIADSSGNFYGTTYVGGDGNCSGDGCGTVFGLTPDGTKTVLHSFKGGKTDGRNPYSGGLIVDVAGNLYGTTPGGGQDDIGIVFRLAPNGAESILASFGVNKLHAAYPEGSLLAGPAGNLYGATEEGGDGNGTVYRLAPDGTAKVLHSFGARGPDGIEPQAGLIADSANNLYGTTYGGGGANCGLGCGTVYKITPR